MALMSAWSDVVWSIVLPVLYHVCDPVIGYEALDVVFAWHMS